MLVITDIYAAGEKPIEGINSDKLYKGILAHGHKNVSYFKKKKEIMEYLTRITKKGDMLITLGAGDIYKIGEAFLKEKI